MMESLDRLIVQLRGAKPATQASIKAELLVFAKGENGSRVREHLADAKRGELLETQWILEEVLDETAPPPPEVASTDAPPEEPPTPDPNARLTSADLQLVYDDPNGLMLHKSRVGERWFATQVDPQTQQPQTFELQAAEIQQIQGQLRGSPYWLIGG
jgi:hypothetical protein